MKNTRWAILGASRGLGRCISLQLAEALTQGLEPHESSNGLLLLSRKQMSLDKIQFEIRNLSRAPLDLECRSFDFADISDDNLIRTKQALHEFQPHSLVYCAGGGPHGKYHTKAWKDHEWSLNVTLLFPMKLTLALFTGSLLSDLNQICFIGSAIAEEKPDPLALSYCAAKHGLVGFVETLQMEQPALDIRLYSPGYMNTDLLPRGSGPQGVDPNIVARDFLKWAKEPCRQPRRRSFLGS